MALRPTRWLLAALTAVLVSGGAMASDEHLGGYLIIPTGERFGKQYNAGYSLYVACWPLMRNYPGHSYQTGLPGTWMFAQYDGEAPKDCYSDVEGGLGWWRDTRFPTEAPKFIMGGVGPNFSDIANGPSHGWGDWNEPRGLYGVAQLSPWLVFPIDGLNIKQGVCGELFGWGYFNLPLAEPKATTEGQAVPTGGNCWTLFLNAGNFRGPLAFFTPNFWSHATVKERRLAGQLLDTRPCDPNRHVQMETQWTPAQIAKDAKGESYCRVAPVQFPRDASGRSPLVHRNSAYTSAALYDAVQAWFGGGPVASGQVDAKDPKVVSVSEFPGQGGATWQIWVPQPDGSEIRHPITFDRFGKPAALDPHTFGLTWDPALTSRTGSRRAPLVTLPEYYHLENADDEKNARWVPVAADQVPAETGLAKLTFERPKEKVQEPYTTPDDPQSCWHKPGPVAGPFRVKLGDGSTLTYSWYRFADQPAMLNADLTDAEREAMQKRVEMLHRAWTKDRQYLPPPTVGKLADVDPAQLVTPPKGFEIGYVPIATRQEMAGQ